MNFHQHDRPRIEVSTIPIINIVFLLLIFFIVQGTIKNQDVLPVEAPTSQSGQEVIADPIEIIVAEDEVILDLELITQNILQSELEDILHKDPEQEIMLKADSDLPAHRLIEILKIVRKAGGTNLYMVTSSPF